MSLLLDTNVLLWWLAADARLTPRAQRAIADDPDAVVSAVSVWEIAIKRGLGKLDVDDTVYDRITASGFRLLPVLFAHAVEVEGLPVVHRDPFDRMLVAQARHEGLALVTADRRLASYPVTVIPAG